MVTQHLSRTRTGGTRVAAAAQHLYEAECALHTAHQSHVDAWIAAASERLHEAVVEYLAAQASARRAEGRRPVPSQVANRPVSTVDGES